MDPLSARTSAYTSTTLNNSVDLTDTPHDAQGQQSGMRFQARDDVVLLRELVAVERALSFISDSLIPSFGLPL